MVHSKCIYTAMMVRRTLCEDPAGVRDVLGDILGATVSSVENDASGPKAFHSRDPDQLLDPMTPILARTL